MASKTIDLIMKTYLFCKRLLPRSIKRAYTLFINTVDEKKNLSLFRNEVQQTFGRGNDLISDEIKKKKTASWTLFHEDLKGTPRYSFKSRSRHLAMLPKLNIKTRSSALSGERIEAFQRLPSWMSDSRFSHHMAVERRKAITNHLEKERKKASLNKLWCHLLNESSDAKDNPTQDPNFYLPSQPKCADEKSIMDKKEREEEEEKLLLSKISQVLVNTSHENARSSLENSLLAHPFFPSEPQEAQKEERILDKLLAKDHLLNSISQNVGYHETSVGVHVNPYEKNYKLSLARPRWSFETEQSLLQGISSVSSQVGHLEVSAMTSALNEEVGVGVGYEDYGVFVDRSVAGRATGITFLSPNVESNTLADFKDHHYGQRLRVGKFEIALRHDFDEFQHPDLEEMSTEFLVGYGDIGVFMSHDLQEKAYGIGTHIRGHHIEGFHDFDDHISKFSASLPKGSKFVLEYDLPDKKNAGLSGELGLGFQDKIFVQIGAGITASNLPEAHLKATGRQSKVSVSFTQSKNSSLVDYAVQLRGSSFGQQFSFDPSKLQIPQVLGLTSSRLNHIVKNLLSPLGLLANQSINF